MWHALLTAETCIDAAAVAAKRDWMDQTPPASGQLQYFPDQLKHSIKLIVLRS
jgi:hypothetical protein